jgi:hypothetical protein
MPNIETVLTQPMDKSDKSLVGEPVFWPGLVYSPLNISGLIFAVGTIAEKAGLIFEEFSPDGETAVCRRKTEAGWERLKVAFSVRSSEYRDRNEKIDMLICWIDDSDEVSIPARLELSKFPQQMDRNVQSFSSDSSIRRIPDGVREDFLSGKVAREEFEETVRQLDSRIKKLKDR